MTPLLRIAPAALLSAAAFANDVFINEIRIDQPGGDDDEYFELIGAPGASLDGYAYVVIGDGSTGSGTVESVTLLDGLALDADGLFVVAESTFTLGTADLVTDINFENSDNVTHLLVLDGAPMVGDDLDTDDDGVLDIIPWAFIKNGVALIETTDVPASGDYYYSNLPGVAEVGPDGPFVPGHVYRCAEGFEIGDFGIGEATETPGGFNVCDQPRINEVRIDQPGGDDDEYFELAGPPGASLDGFSYVVLGDGSTGSGTVETVVPLDGFVIGANGLFLVAESTFTLGAADFVTDLNFENSDNVTHLLVRDGAPAVGDDLDMDDDGMLDNPRPWLKLFDGVALVETFDVPASGDFFYSNVIDVQAVGPDGPFVPGHVFRCGGTFRIGSFGTGEFTETPGAANVCEAPTSVFCSPAEPNSVSATGSQISIASAGGGFISDNDASLVVTNTPDEFGLFAQSMSTITPTPLMNGGLLCLGFPDIQRLNDPILASGNTASLQLDFFGLGAESATMAGVTMYYQWWHRDTTPGGANFSEGLAVTWLE